MSDLNSRYHSPFFPTHQSRGSLLRINWQLDFTYMPTVRRVRNLLVLVDKVSGWVEASLTTNKMAQIVSDFFLWEIIPCFGIPTSLQSDNSPKFTFQNF